MPFDDERFQGYIKSLEAQLAVRGHEIAKLSKRIYHQRLVIREITGPIGTTVKRVEMASQDVSRENSILKDQIAKLKIENRELRLYIATVGK